MTKNIMGTATNEVATINGTAHTIARTPDVFHRLEELNVNGSTAYYGYDSEGRMAAVSNQSFSLQYAYSPDSLDVGHVIDLPNSTISREVTRDPHRRQLITAITNKVDGIPYKPLALSYNVLNHLISRNNDTFDYNARGEVTAANIQPTHYSKYDYDYVGNNNWASVNTVTNYYTANALNQYTSISAPSTPMSEPQYDLDGNLLINGHHTFTWDADNRLTAIYSGGTLVLSNAYDHASRRVLKITPTGTHAYLYDGWNLVQESVATTSGTTTYRYIWGKDLSGTLQGAGGVGGLVAVSINNAWHFPLYDNNGNVLAYVSSTGTIVAEYIYDAFGNTINQSGTMENQFHHRFSTKYLDPETNLYYYGYRFYDPALMRWLNRDPIEEKGGVNLYGFVGNDSVNWFDRLGLSPNEIYDFFNNPNKKAEYNISRYLDVTVYCTKKASKMRHTANVIMLGFAGTDRARTTVESFITDIDCHCGTIQIVINPRIGTPPGIRMPLHNSGATIFGSGWGVIPDLFNPPKGWETPYDFWGSAIENGGVSTLMGTWYPNYQYPQAQFNAGAFIDHKEAGSNQWRSISHRENLFTQWRTFDNSVHQDEINIKVDVKRGDQVSIQIGSAGEPILSRRQIITIR